MNMDENEDGGFEVEASPTFFGSSGGGGLVPSDDIEQLPQQDDESTMNDESTIAASSYISRGYSYVASNTKWVFVVMAATFVVFFSIGVGLGYGPIGNSIYRYLHLQLVVQWLLSLQPRTMVKAVAEPRVASPSPISRQV